MHGALETKRYKAKNDNASHVIKSAMMNTISLSLRDVHLGISAIDKIVGDDENLCQNPEKGTYRHTDTCSSFSWSKRKSNDLNFERNNKAFSEGGFEQYCAQRHQISLKESRRSQMNEHGYISCQQSGPPSKEA